MNKLFYSLACVLILIVFAETSYGQITMQGPVMRIESPSIKGTWIAYDPAATPILDHICGIFFGSYVVYKISDTDSYYLMPVPEYRQYANLNYCLISKAVHDQTFRILRLIAEKEEGSFISHQTANAFLDNLVKVKMKNAPVISVAQLNQWQEQQIARENKNLEKTSLERKETEKELEAIINDSQGRIHGK